MKKIYLIATVVAIITGIAVYLFASRLQTGRTVSQQVNMINVVVAATEINENSKITKEMLTTAQFPAGTVPQTAITDMNSVIGKIAKNQISKGEQLLQSKILVVGDDGNNELSERLQKGYRAFTISVDKVSGIAGFLRVGDRIDLIITRQIEGASTTQYYLQDIKIIAIGDAAQNGSSKGAITTYDNITLEIKAEDCTGLTYNIINGLVKIVLRGYGDDGTITAPIVNK
jgi:pilus assembly protein CpaB